MKMGSKWVFVLGVVFIFLSLTLEGECLSKAKGCLEEERVALLQLKHFFNHPDSSVGSECCQWESVECNNTTGRVIKLNLRLTRKRDLREWYLNASLFYAFEELESLDLSGNSIAGFVENGGLDKLSRSSNLESLDLGSNMFNNDILSSLNALSSLKYLYLYDNRLNETVDLQRLNNLEELNMRYNEVENFILPKGLNGLSNLKILNLESNMLNNSILSSLTALPSLRRLYLSNIRLKGIVDVSGLNNLEELYMMNNEIEKFILAKGAFSSLKELYLNGNKIVDFQGLDGLSNLEVLDLAGNMLNNSILSSLSLAALPSLRTLFLSDIGLKGIVDISGLGSLHNLEYLYMDDNQIDKLILPEGSTDFRKLKTLDLSRLSGLNVVNGSTLFRSLGSFPSLKILYLQSSNFSETTATAKNLHNLTNVEELYLDDSSLHISLLQSISAFTFLKILSMRDCQLNGILDFQELPNFKNLKRLDMSGTSLDFSFLQTSGMMMTSLELLSLSNCGLEGTLSNQGLCEIVHLQQLYLNNNDLKGILPSCFANLISLQVLDLSFNQFTGDISLSPIKALISIEELRLSNNHFQIPISLEPFFNLSKLKRFFGENNQNYAETETHSSTPKFQLSTIMLSCCGDGGILPQFLHHQHDLREVDLAHNNLTGEFPNWLLENNTKLEHLVLSNNSLSGPFQLPIDPHMDLAKLDISLNFFHGNIPKEIGGYLSSLTSLNFSRNAFDGTIPSSIGDMNSLYSLDLSYNQLCGKIPEHLAESCTSLQLLVLSNNSIQGQIFSTNFDLRNLLRLQLDGNNFTGKIPDSLSKASKLAGLYLSDNKLSGGIPSWLGNMSSLEDIIMPNNHLEGPIPLEFCQLNNLEVLNLAKNNISGGLPSCFSPPFITQVHLSENRLEGQIKEAFYNSSFFVTLDLGYNRFDGIIPTWIGRLSHLTYLTLSNNNFESEVPTQLCQLNQLRLIDLSHNNLFGHIPPCLDDTALYDNDYDVVTPSSIATPPAEPPSSSDPQLRKEETVQFTTKNNSYFYQGKVLSYMSGIDLSCNKLIGLIPLQIGNLTRIRTLNLSHNNLTGPIPPTFAKLEKIESFDLSYNNLSGEIPPQLVELYSLSFFSIAHNNFSGKIPVSTQFCTFGDHGYEGNPFLYGLPLSKSCGTAKSPLPMPRATIDNGEDDLFYMDIFYITFTVSYIIVFLGTVVVLYINPYWW